MAYINNKNLPYLVEKLSNADNIKINNNKHGSRVSTVINSLVTKSDNITKAIEQEVINDNYSFKVGTGDVNVSADVQDGFGEIGIKGVTYQNVFNDFSIVGEASKYVTANGNTIKWTKPAATTSHINIKYHNSLAQLNKTYTLVFYVYKNTLKIEGAGNSYDVAKFNIVSYDTGNYLMPVNKTGLVQVKLIQPTTTRSDGKPYLEVYKGTVGELEISYPILLEGDHTNNPNLSSCFDNPNLSNYFEGIVGVGNKSKNLFDGEFEIGSIEWQTGTPNIYDGEIRTKNFIPVKPNKYYILNVFENSYENHNIHFYDINKQWLGNPIHNRNLSSINFVTPRNCYYIKFRLTTPNFKTKVQLEEGSVTTPYEPYYEGHKIEILSNGKNLANPNNIIDSNRVNDRSWNVIKEDNGIFYCESNGSDARAFALSLNLFNLKDNTSYRVSYSVETNGTVENGDVAYAYVGTDTLWDTKKAIPISNNTFANPTGNRRACLGIYYRNAAPVRIIKIYNLQVVEVPQDSKFEPYQEDKTQILLDEPLMRLPNGVCDEITRDGKLIRRVGKVVFDGSESWTLWYESSNTIGFIYRHISIMDKNWYSSQMSLVCDRFIPKSGRNFNEDDSEAIAQWNVNNSIFIRINKNSLETLDVNGFKQWLQANPTTVYYELAEPVITELPAPCLRIFKDGQITFNTLVIPESNHVVQLNKSAQIERSIREIQSLDGRVEQLESFYDDMMLETSYKLDLLNYDFEYTKEREDK